MEPTITIPYGQYLELVKAKEDLIKMPAIIVTFRNYIEKGVAASDTYIKNGPDEALELIKKEVDEYFIMKEAELSMIRNDKEERLKYDLRVCKDLVAELEEEIRILKQPKIKAPFFKRLFS